MSGGEEWREDRQGVALNGGFPELALLPEFSEWGTEALLAQMRILLPKGFQ